MDPEQPPMKKPKPRSKKFHKQEPEYGLDENGLNDTERIQNFMKTGYRTKNLLNIGLSSTNPELKNRLNDPHMLREIH
jgi:hypothetical protein